jgi:aryl-phospho-beta-D-glucosidase BglC (GH1 family)
MMGFLAAPLPLLAASNDLIVQSLFSGATGMAFTVNYPSSLAGMEWVVYSAQQSGTKGQAGLWAQGSAFSLTGMTSTTWMETNISSNGLRLFAPANPTIDTDNDRMSDADEILCQMTSPSQADTDGDHSPDGEEIQVYGTDPLNQQSSPQPNWLRTDGSLIRDASNRIVQLRGVNIGAWLAYEQWMTQFQPTNIADEATLRQTLDTRFNPTGTVYLLNLFRDAYFNTNDLNRIAEWGYNCIRLPFLYNLLEDDTNTYHYKDTGWARLDGVIEQCRQRNLYCILCLHGAPGSQNDFAHSGQAAGNRNRLWSNEVFKARTVALWAEIARRYSNEAVVAGYDLLNEPDPRGGDKQTLFTNSIVPLHDRIYRAIRSNDTRHIVFMESNILSDDPWGKCYWMPDPASMGWTNIVYEFHHYERVVYSPTNDFSFQTHKWLADTIAREYTQFQAERKVPVYIGEFMPVNQQNIDYYMRTFNAAGLNWSHWSFKHWGWEAGAPHPWSSWGLFYRTDGSNSTLKPNISTHSFSQLADRLTAYGSSHSSNNPHLGKIAERHAELLRAAPERTEFYVNTFSAPNATSLASLDAWPWQKLSLSSANNSSFIITNRRGRLIIQGSTNIQLHLKSRLESAARFTVHDETGCWFAVELSSLGPSSAVQFGVARDELATAIYHTPTPGLLVRCFEGGANIQLQVYAKANGTVGFGTNLFDSGFSIPFAAGKPLEVFVNRTNCILRYNGTNRWSGTHGLDFSDWTAGAVNFLEADNNNPGSVARTHVEMETLKAWRPDAAANRRFDGDFAGQPDWIPLLAVPDRWSVQDFGTNTANQNAYIINGRAVWIPARVTWGGTWLNPRHNYQTDVRLQPTGPQAAEARVILRNFDNGVAKICWMPEYFPREIYWLYNNPALYAEVKYSGGKLVFDIVHFKGPNSVDWKGAANNITYVSGRSISFQVTTNRAAIYYGTNLLVNVEHGITNFAQAFPHGVFPHFEYANDGTLNNASVDVEQVLVRTLPGFTAPEL